MISKVTYKGSLRTEAIHVQSGNTIITDAPIDNHGKGEAFSPTDLVATALASCMLTIMGIVANRNHLKINGTTAEIEKIMGANPRRINEIKIRNAGPTANAEARKRGARTAVNQRCLPGVPAYKKAVTV